MDKKEIQINIEKALEEIRPYLKTDGGDISLVSVENNTAKVKLLGTCTQCTINKMTLIGIEETIKRFVPQITEVVSI